MAAHETKNALKLFHAHGCFDTHPNCTIIVTGCECNKGPMNADQMAAVAGVLLFTCPFCGSTVAKISRKTGDSECPHAAAIEAKLARGWNPYTQFTLGQLRAARRGQAVR